MPPQRNLYKHITRRDNPKQALYMKLCSVEFGPINYKKALESNQRKEPCFINCEYMKVTTCIRLRAHTLEPQIHGVVGIVGGWKLSKNPISVGVE